MTSVDPTPRFGGLKDNNNTTATATRSSMRNGSGENGFDGSESPVEPVLAKATSLLLNSGNVVSSDRLKKKTNLNPQDEV